MSLSRRQFAAVAALTGLAPRLAWAEPPVPVIIAEGGAAEKRLEDTRSALDLAIDQGCDFLQVNVVPTKEGALVARRDNELSASTDVADRFAERGTTKTVDGQSVGGWFAEDFSLAELKTLTCREPRPALRPQNVKLGGKEPILTLDEVLQIAQAGCVRTARTIGVCPRMIHVGYFAGLGLPVDERLAAGLSTAGYVAAAAAIWVQAFEPEALKSFGRLSRLRRMQLIETSGEPPGGHATYASLTTTAGLADVRAHAEAIAPDQDLVLDPAGAVFPTPTTLVLDAHSAGLQVFSRTARAENAFLPPKLRKGDPHSHGFEAGHGDVDRLLASLFANGVDGLATDLPDEAARARKDAIAQVGKTPAKSR